MQSRKIKAAGNLAFLEFHKIDEENVEALLSEQDPLGYDVPLPELNPPY